MDIRSRILRSTEVDLSVYQAQFTPLSRVWSTLPEKSSGKECGFLSWTAAGNQAYLSMGKIKTWHFRTWCDISVTWV